MRQSLIGSRGHSCPSQQVVWQYFKLMKPNGKTALILAFEWGTFILKSAVLLYCHKIHLSIFSRNHKHFSTNVGQFFFDRLHTKLVLIRLRRKAGKWERLPVPVFSLCFVFALLIWSLAVRAVTVIGVHHLFPFPALHLQLSQTSCERSHKVKKK